MTHPNPPPEQNHILDGLLDELLDQQTPPVPSLESLLRNEPNNSKRFTPEEIEQALFAAQRIRSHKLANKAPNPQPKPSRNSWLVWSSIAATLLGVSLVVWRKQPSSQIPETNLVASGQNSNLNTPSENITNNVQNHKHKPLPASDLPTPKTKNSEPGNEAQKSIDQNDKVSNIASVPSPLQNTPQVNSLSNASLNPATLENKPTLQNRNTPQNRTVNLSERRLGTESDRNIIAVIDHQFEDMWGQLPAQKASSRFQASPNPIERMAQYLLARPANPTELEALRQAELLTVKDGSKQNAEWIDAVTSRWINSEEFARQWAKRLSNFYRGDYPVRIDQLDRYKAFELWLAEHIHNDTPLNVIQTEVLQGLWKLEHPARFLVDHWTGLSAESNSMHHQTNSAGTDRVSLSPQIWVELPERQQSTLTSLTHLFLRITDNANLACAQCHQSSGTLAGQSVPPPAKYQSSDIHSTQEPVIENTRYAGEQFVRSDKSAKPIAFGSIAALLVGVIEPERQELFTRDAEDRLIKLLPVTPDGIRIAENQSRADTMAEWAQRGSHFHRGPINALWKSFFGVHLVRPSERFAKSRTSSRDDLLEFLSEQSTSQNASLRQLAYWMLHSAPTRQPDISLLANDLLTLDTDTRRDISIRLELQFLQIAPSGSSPLTQDYNQQTPANHFGKFISQAVPPPQELQQRALLAQPVTQPAVQNSTQTSPATQPFSTPNPALTELFIACPPNEIAVWESQWSINTLTQPMLIDHAYLMLRGRLPNNSEHQTWSQSHLHQYDRADAIRRLIGAVANFEYPFVSN